MDPVWAPEEPRSALPGGVDRVAWKSGSATGKSLQVEPCVRNAQGSVGD